MTGLIATERPRTQPSSPPSRPFLWGPWLLVLGWASQVIVRLILSQWQDAPIIFPDESGYLVAARWLAGGPVADLSGSTLYQGGYSLLLVPAYLFGSDPEVVYRGARIITALVSAGIFPLAYFMLVRCGLRSLHAYPLAWAAALIPASTFFGLTALADGVLPVVMLGWLLAMDRFVRHETPTAAALVGALAGYALAVHLRGSVVVAVTGLVMAAYLVRGRARPSALLGLAIIAGTSAAALTLNSRLADALYPDGPLDLSAVLRAHLSAFDGQMWAISGGVGQVWAMTAGTWGLGALGLITVVTVLFRGRTPREDRIMVGVLLLVTIGTAYASTAALPDEHRVGNFAYGRYLAGLALVYMLIGLAVVVRKKAGGREILAAVALICGAALWVAVYAGSRLRTHDFIGWDFPEVGLLGGSYDKLRMPVTTAVACALLVMWWGLRRWGVQKLFTALLVVNLCAMTVLIGVLAAPRAKPIPSIPGGPTGGVVLDRRLLTEVHVPSLVVSRIAFAVSWTKAEWFDSRQGPPGPGVCAAVVVWPAGILAQDTWPERPPGWQFKRAQGNGTWWVIWYDPACPSAR
ncbi:hypothetical protein [Actinomadura sp. HBU206391]|uniref:hypothetical protein n=1 Tax=Actinomadura sp. HBU206391 TaxID=2731692 RepID=UPI00164F61BF|nr:hypothetical protein [Actinomadura sp. HBU206391]MBC6457753.1 hypothetical protein [Actinomadura sp. HBU206391]